MAYFSNGSEGLDYQERYCFRCLNYIDTGNGCGTGCPIWNAHLVYAYEVCNEKNGRGILAILIPEVKSEYGDYEVAGECSMFREEPPAPLIDLMEGNEP